MLFLFALNEWMLTRDFSGMMDFQVVVLSFIYYPKLDAVQTMRGDRRGGQGDINTAGFNIRSRDRHSALYCGTCFGNQMKPTEEHP